MGEIFYYILRLFIYSYIILAAFKPELQEAALYLCVVFLFLYKDPPRSVTGE